jgi:hypothetical protein
MMDDDSIPVENDNEYIPYFCTSDEWQSICRVQWHVSAVEFFPTSRGDERSEIIAESPKVFCR